MATNQNTTSKNETIHPISPNQNGLSSQELFDQIIAKIKENLDQDVADKIKDQNQAEFILSEQTTYLKTYLKL